MSISAWDIRIWHRPGSATPTPIFRWRGWINSQSSQTPHNLSCSIPLSPFLSLSTSLSLSLLSTLFLYYFTLVPLLLFTTSLTFFCFRYAIFFWLLPAINPYLQNFDAEGKETLVIPCRCLVSWKNLLESDSHHLYPSLWEGKWCKAGYVQEGACRAAPDTTAAPAVCSGHYYSELLVTNKNFYT